ncbi:MAG: SAM-dependent methyltransferase [Bacilli bacterium]|nr:SAM-dependent methyltransferase [Bacilli bacterium]
MKINARLKKIGDLVEANSFCLDVGCDHALLDIYLVRQNKNIRAVASDVKEGPVLQAKKNIEQEKLEEVIEVRLGDGLSTYTKDIDTVIISGMGGRNIISICKNDMKNFKMVSTYILSPNNYQEDVKRFFVKNGYYIANEEFVKDKRFIYQIIILKKGKKKYTKKEFFFGPVFLLKKGPLFREYYEREMKAREILLDLLPKNFKYKRYKTNKEINLIKQEIKD